MSSRRNDKQKPLGIGATIPKFAGALVGLVIVVCRKVGLCIGNMMTVRSGPSTRIAKKPMQVRAEKKAGATEKKKTESRQATRAKKSVWVRTRKKKGTGERKTKGKKAKTKRKMVKARRAPRPRNRQISNKPAVETNIAVESQKPQPPRAEVEPSNDL